MVTQISITKSNKQQLAAASALSEYLETIGCKHAYIGGFAWALLGSDRPTEDVDVLIESKDLTAIREKLTELNQHFSIAGFKLFYIKELIGDLKGDELIRAARDNVMIETLEAGKLGLPTVAAPIYPIKQMSGADIPILHPSILILTKMKRWCLNYESDRPKTVFKNKSDQDDLNFLIHWLEEHQMMIDFDHYQGKTKQELLVHVRQYRNRLRENTELMESLANVLTPDDWKLLDE
ncbi:hypothetical protein BD410DRAFT_199766 [Rickenella mellea]|uniref:Nucleotidyltransferase n=1 Tax=Rickenella mellea TaxID=50990 RepID=A0A4Y7Q7E1_9AGAM|nr:hypothetical protein BD410DRAFT_199766 [Rickenella mellea]